MSAAHRAREWRRGALACGVLLACAALALPAQAAYAAPHDPPISGESDVSTAEGDTAGDELSQESLQALLDRLQSLYRKAEAATEDYNDAKDKLKKQRTAVKDLNRKLDTTREAVREHRRDAGQLARRQYMNGGLSGYSKLLLSEDPQTALDRGHLLGQTAKVEAETIRRLQTEERDLDRLTGKQEKALGKIEKTAKKQRAARDKVDDQLDRVERIVSTLTGAQLDELQALEEQGFNASQADFLRSGALGTGSRAPSKAGRKAVAYAFNQLGEPYVWGAEGPDAFDCSGLTSQAWLHAGRSIPRTSQEQWKQLPKIALNQLRPGDLVIYYPGATHVGMYIGNGMIVQAPRPGGFVKVSPVGSMPVIGAVRPDPEAGSSGSYETPEIPESAQKPTPIGSGKSPKKAKSDKRDSKGEKGAAEQKEPSAEPSQDPVEDAVNTAEGTITTKP